MDGALTAKHISTKCNNQRVETENEHLENGDKLCQKSGRQSVWSFAHTALTQLLFADIPPTCANFRKLLDGFCKDYCDIN